MASKRLLVLGCGLSLVGVGCGIVVSRDLSAVPPGQVGFDDMCGLQAYFDALEIERAHDAGRRGGLELEGVEISLQSAHIVESDLPGRHRGEVPADHDAAADPDERQTTPQHQQSFGRHGSSESLGGYRVDSKKLREKGGGDRWASPPFCLRGYRPKCMIQPIGPAEICRPRCSIFLEFQFYHYKWLLKFRSLIRFIREKHVHFHGVCIRC